ncbi:MAG: protein phosphatase 2C domain-containing protein [Pirellulales bacterium]
MLARIISSGRTDIGKRRDSNQDHFLIADLYNAMSLESTSLKLDSRLHGTSHGKLLMVADGMGGHAGGSRASTLAIDLLVKQLLDCMHCFFHLDAHSEEREQYFIEDLKRMMQKTHEAIEKESNETENKGMGTTLTMSYVTWPWMYVVHAGDSRCYLMRGNRILQLTNDHTVTQQLIENGMPADEAARSPWNNVLYNALGAGGSSVRAEIQKVQLNPGDFVLLCSDGLNRHVSDGDITNVLQQVSEPTVACQQLIDLANERGGQDNVTVVVAKVLEPESSDSSTAITAEITREYAGTDTTKSSPARERAHDTDEHPIHDTLEFK